MDPMHATVIPQPDAANYLPAQPVAGDLNEQLLDTDFWTDEMVAAAGIPIVDVPFVTVGGGIGTFVTVDYLRIAGVPTRAHQGALRARPPVADLRVPHPGLPDPARRAAALRLGVAPGQHLGLPVATPFAEGFATKPLKIVRGRSSSSRSSPTTTPRTPGQVFRGMEREANRIRYYDMLAKGLVRMVRRRYGGGYFTILTPPEGVTGDQAGRVPLPLRARRGRLPGAEVPARPAGATAPSTRTTTTSSTPTSRTSTSTSG